MAPTTTERSRIFTEADKVFIFVTDEQLRNNLSLSLGYLFHLTFVRDVFSKDKDVQPLTSRDMIIHVATILEGLLFYCLETKINNGALTSWQAACKKTKKEVAIKELHSISSKERIAIMETKYVPYQLMEVKANFVILTEVCRDSKILGPKLFEKVEAIRRHRNGIHLSGRDNIKNITYKDAERSMEILRQVLKRVKKQLAV